MMKRKLWILGCLLCLLPGLATAAEVIHDYFSEIEIATDGSMTVEEHIKVTAEGKQIKRGIFRDFPTDYKDQLGNRYQVGFELLGVWRDNQPEDYHTERRGNGIRIYIGNKNRYLKHGVYQYRIRYRTNRQLGFFEDHDELYWNVTGNGWAFPIEQAGARVHLPVTPSSGQVKLHAYTGPSGAKGQQYQAHLTDDQQALFTTTGNLAPHEGLTIVVGWPKGIVHEPTQREKAEHFLSDNRDALIGIIGLALLLGYYSFSWRLVGRDPDTGPIIPLYEPPEGHSPAAMRFIERMGYDNQAFAAAIINMAVEGYLTIKQGSGDIFTLRKTGNEAKLAAGEKALSKALFAGKGSSITLIKGNHKNISAALKAHKLALQLFYEKRYFVTNRSYLIPGILLTLITWALTLMNGETEEAVGALFMVVWLTFWSLAVFKMVQDLYRRWREVLTSGGALKTTAATAATLFSLPFLGGEVMGFWMLLNFASTAFVITLIGGLLINYLFYEWLKAPTRAGQQLLQEIQGFKLYLSVAEQEELNFKHPKEKTPELFEAYLPYALALGVEQQWGEYFAAELAQAKYGPEGYHPGWYSGRHWSPHRIGTFSHALGSSMASTISSSSTAPGSSSGFSGGGSSGGGGGGGGGGGW